jgi:hypothetical protein
MLAIPAVRAWVCRPDPHTRVCACGHAALRMHSLKSVRTRAHSPAGSNTQKCVSAGPLPRTCRHRTHHVCAIHEHTCISKVHHVHIMCVWFIYPYVHNARHTMRAMRTMRTSWCGAHAHTPTGRKSTIDVCHKHIMCVLHTHTFVHNVHKQCASCAHDLLVAQAQTYKMCTHIVHYAHIIWVLQAHIRAK